MLTRMSYIWQNNEGHKYFKAASMAGGNQGNTRQFLRWSNASTFTYVLFKFNRNKVFPHQSQCLYQWHQSHPGISLKYTYQTNNAYKSDMPWREWKKLTHKTTCLKKWFFYKLMYFFFCFSVDSQTHEDICRRWTVLQFIIVYIHTHIHMHKYT